MIKYGVLCEWPSGNTELVFNCNEKESAMEFKALLSEQYEDNIYTVVKMEISYA